MGLAGGQAGAGEARTKDMVLGRLADGRAERIVVTVGGWVEDVAG